MNPDAGYRSRFRHETETAQVGYYAVTLDDYGIRAELTATTRTGIQRYTFPEAEEARILVDLKTPTEYGYVLRDAVVRRVSDSEIEGASMQFTHDEFTGFDNDYTVHFVMHYRVHRLEGSECRTAVCETFGDTSRPMIMTSVFCCIPAGTSKHSFHDL